MTLFTEPAERAKAMGVFGFVAVRRRHRSACCSAASSPTRSTGTGSSSSTSRSASPSSSLSLRLAAAGARPRPRDGRLDVAGAVTVTAALMLAVYAIVNGNEAGWTSAQTLGLLAVAAALLGVFLVIESRVARAARAARALPAAQRRDRERRRRALGGGDVRLVLPLGALPAARARLQPAPGRPRVPAGEPDHGRVLARALGEARDALRHPGCRWRRACGLGRGRARCSSRARRSTGASSSTSCRA